MITLSSSRQARRLALTALVVCSLFAPAARAEIVPHGGMMRFPAISADRVAFVYAGDIWTVGRDGGTATRLVAPAGMEARPRFSPDGGQLAFMGNYEGDTDLYVIDVEGGIARRVTHHPATEILQQWTRDGRLLYASGAEGAPRGNLQLYLVSPEGGMPEKLAVEFGAMAAIDGDGRRLAFTPWTRDHRTWKRYRGGMSTDLWMLDLRTLESQRLTTWEGTDTAPMWHEGSLYYLSDQGPEHRWNLWRVDPSTGERRQVTRFADFDVKEPSIGAGSIVFQQGASIHRLDLGSGDVTELEISIPGERPDLRPERVDVSENILGWNVSSTGKRALVEMRGDVWSVPLEEGIPVNLTATDGFAEREAVWSPDGRWIAYFSDVSGEYEIHVRSSDGKGEARQVGKFGAPFKEWLGWSPKSDRLAYVDKTGTLYLVDVESGRRTEVNQDPWGNAPTVAWSHDGAWIAYTADGDNMLGSIWFYEVATGEKTPVTSGAFDAGSPAFDRKGEFFYYVSARDFSSPTYEEVGTTFVYDDVDVVHMVPLRRDVELPHLPQDDQEEWDDDADDGEKKDDAEKDGDGEDEEKDEAPIRIDLDGLESRAVALDLDGGSFTQLTVVDGGALVYRTGGWGSDGAIKIYDAHADEPEEKTVIEGVGPYRPTADGKKLLVRKGKQFALIDAEADQKFEDAVSVDGLETMIDPRAEWNQIFTDSWRFFRDYFYDDGMHGVDWKRVGDQYRKMLADCSSRVDVEFVIKEMISELNVGHAYHGGGDFEKTPSRDVGLLGVDFELDRGAYRFARIHRGAPWDSDARSPFDTAKGEVSEGDYLLAVNGRALDVTVDPWAAFIGTAGEVTRLTVSGKPRLDEDAREVLVKPMRSDNTLRYRAWIEHNRQHVYERSGGRVGYIYVPNTGVDGQNDLFRQFYGQRHMDALIIDERWNGGGQIPTRFVELLNRPRTNYWAVRDGEKGYFPWPPDSHQGPKCMLINGLAGSGGDAFPAYFKQAGVGKLIGERTWGGLVGISGSRPIIDGAFLAVPSFAYFDKDGTWGIEGHGVDPDIEIVADPGQLAKGIDPQLEAAIDHMLEEIERDPYRAPRVPEGPDRSGMGIAPEDM